MAITRPIRQLRAKRTRIQLLDAARRVFSERGYAGTTVDDIAKAAGVSKGSFYFHFATKEDALLALISEWASDVSKQLDPFTKGRADLSETLDALLSMGGPEWQPLLLLEFWSQAARSMRVQDAVSMAQRTWRASATKLVGKAQRSGLLADGATVESAVNALSAMRGGLIAQASLNGSASSSRRSATRASLALLERPRPRLRRAV